MRKPDNRFNSFNIQDFLRNNKANHRLSEILGKVKDSETIAVVIENGLFVSANDTAFRFLDLKKDENLTTTHLNELIDAESWVNFKNLAYRKPTNDRIFNLTMRFLKPESAHIDTYTVIIPMYDINALTHLILVFDSKAEPPSPNTIQRILEKSNNAHFILNVDKQGEVFLAYANEQFKQETGYNKNTTESPLILSVLPDTIRHPFEDCLRECLTKRISVKKSLQINNLQQIVQIELTPITTPLGDIYQIHGSFKRDLTTMNQRLELMNYLFLTALNNAPYSIFICSQSDLEHFIFVNDEACRILGYTKEELQQMSVLDIDPAIDRRLLEIYNKEALENGFVRFESKHRTKTNQIFPVEVSLTYSLVSGKNYVISQVRDLSEINDQKIRFSEAHKKLNENSALFNNLLKNSKDCIHVVEVLEGKHFRFTEANEQFEKLANVKREQCFGRTLKGILSDEIADILNSNYRLCYEKGDVIERTMVFRSENGKRNLFSKYIPIRDASGAIHQIMVVCQDITEELNIKNDLDYSQHLIANTEHLASLGYYSLNTEGSTLYTSGGLKRILGFPDEESFLRGTCDVFSFTHEDDKNRIFSQFRESVINRSRFDEVYRIVTPDGIAKSVRNHGHLAVDDNNSLVFRGCIQDLSSFFFLEQEVSALEEQKRVLADKSPVGIYISDGQGDIYVNQSFLNMLELNSVKEFLRKSILDYVHPDDQYIFSNIKDKLFKSTSNDVEYFEITVRGITATGNTRVFDLRFTTRLVCQTTYLEINIVDISREMEAEKTMNRMAMDALYIHQRNDSILELKKDLELLLDKKGYNPSDFKQIINKLNCYSSSYNDWGFLNKQFENLHPRFIPTLKTRYPDLNTNDIKHCACIRLNFDTKEIARFFNVKPASIQTARARLKKKMNLPEDCDLKTLIAGI